MRHDDESLFAGWRPTGASAELRKRVLEAARRGEPPLEPLRFEDRLWHSRRLRLAWAAATLSLLAFNLWLPANGTDARRGMRAETGISDSPEESPTRRDSDDRPSWSDQRMLLCKLLDDCARTIDGRDNGGRI